MSEAKRECVICCSDLAADEEGVVCDDGHMHCEQCFIEHINSACAVDAVSIRKFRERDCDIYCSFYDSGHCKSNPFNLQYIAYALPAESFQQVIDATIRAREETRIAEVSETSGGDQLALRKEAFVRFMQDQVMNLYCPSCGKAVLDFDGCGAVQCSCTKFFCCWCLAPFAQSGAAHKHVSSCTVGRKYNENHNYYAKKNLFEQCHKDRRGKAISGILEVCDPQMRKEILKDCKKVFRGLDVSVETDTNGKQPAARNTGRRGARRAPQPPQAQQQPPPPVRLGPPGVGAPPGAPLPIAHALAMIHEQNQQIGLGQALRRRLARQNNNNGNAAPEVIVIDDDDDEPAGPAPRPPSGEPSRKRQRATVATPPPAAVARSSTSRGQSSRSRSTAAKASGSSSRSRSASTSATVAVPPADGVPLLTRPYPPPAQASNSLVDSFFNDPPMPPSAFDGGIFGPGTSTAPMFTPTSYYRPPPNAPMFFTAGPFPLDPHRGERTAPATEARSEASRRREIARSKRSVLDRTYGTPIDVISVPGDSTSPSRPLNRG